MMLLILYTRFVIASNFPDESIDAASNYCRNPDSDPDGLWCYTLTGWDYCHVPQCKNKTG